MVEKIKEYKMKYFNVFIISVVCFGFGVQSLFTQTNGEDTKGNPFIFPHPGGQLTINIANNTIKIENLFRFKDNWLLGFGVSGKATNGISPIFSSGEISPGVKFNFNIGYSLGAQKIIRKINKLHEGAISILDSPFKKLDSLLNKVNENKDAIKTYQDLKKVISAYPDYNELKKEIEQLETTKLLKLAKIDKVELEELKRKFGELQKSFSKLLRENVSNPQKENFDISVFDKEINDVGGIKKQLSAYISESTNILIGNEIPRDLDVFNLSTYYEASKFKFFSSDLPFDQQITEETFKGIGLQLSYSHYFNPLRILFTIGAGIKHDNNANTLDTVNIKEDVTSINETGDITRVIEKEITALKGNMETFTNKSVYFSGYYKPFPEYPLSLAAYANLNFNRLRRPLILGFGAFAVNKGNSFKPIAGIVVEYEKDLKNQVEKIPFNKSLKVNLIISLPFFTPSIKY